MINYTKYPISDGHDSNDSYHSLIQQCILQMQENGFVALPDFICPDGLHSLTQSILNLKDGGFYSTEMHNVFLEEDGNKNGSSSSTSPSIHPRHVQLKSSKIIINAHDLSRTAAQLDFLFSSPHFIQFISAILQTTLYPSTDQYGKYYGNIFNKGDGLNWHFDRSEYSVSLILQPAQEGGSFQFAPNSRHVVEDWDEMPANATHVAKSLKTHSIPLQEPRLAAGDLYLFRGQNSLHRVSEIVHGTRINVILTYNTEPDVRLNSYTLKKFFGVDSES